MRELLFRVWDEYDKKMYYGGGFFPPTRDEQWIFGLIVPYNNAIIMQYIGLKDKNGNKIFIGDFLKVIKAYNSYSGLNNETYGNYMVEVKEKEQLGFYLDGGISTYTPTEYEIIGNVYENKDLLLNK